MLADRHTIFAFWIHSMCLVLYLGSDSQLPTTEPWNAGRPFSVSDATANCPAGVREFVKRPFIYCLHSTDGCGCGFYVEAVAEREATLAGMPADIADQCRATDDFHRRSVNQLHAYLTEARADLKSPLQLLVSWAGKESTVPKSRRTITPDYFQPTEAEFHLEEFTLFEIVGR